MNMNEREAGYELLKNGTLVTFEVQGTEIERPDFHDETLVRIDMQLGELDEDGDRTEDWQWGAFGFIFVLALLSFSDGRPRGYSEVEFDEDDGFNIKDFFACLTYERGALRFRADYIRGRSMKTDIDVMPDGKVVLKTRARGEAALRWVDRLKGKKLLQVVQDGDGE